MVKSNRQAPRPRRRFRRALHLVGLLLCGLAFNATVVWAAPLRQMVEFVPGTSAAVQQAIVTASGSTLVRSLPLVNAAAIKLPATNPEVALNYLRSRSEVRNVYVGSCPVCPG